MKSAAPRLAPFVSALGIVQIISWGTLYYSIAVLAKPVALGLGLGDLDLFTAFSIGLLVSGLLAPSVGRWIDRLGGRAVMTAGSLLAVATFVLLATASSAFQYYAGWLVGGLAMSATLYDAGFASLRRLFLDARYRKAVTILTLFGGLASTAFWPLSELLNHLMGWRWTHFIFAALHVGCALVHWASPDRGKLPHEGAVKEAPPRERLFRDPRYWALAIGFACAAFSFSAMSAFSIRALSASGLATGTVIWIVSLIGPMQVAGRFLEYFSARHVGIQRVGTIAHVLLVTALLVLCVVGGNLALAVLFAVIYGVANGAMTIVRGTVPIFLLREVPPGRLLGGLALPSALSRAAAPAVFAFLAHLGGNDTVPIVFCAFLTAVALACYLVACRIASRSPVTG